MSTLDDLMEFLTIAKQQGFVNENTADARRTACVKLFNVLEPGQQTVEYMRDNLDVVAARFSNLNREVRGGTVNEYKRRVQLVLDEYQLWSTDRAAWERKAADRSNKAAAEGERTQRPSRPQKAAKPEGIKVDAAPNDSNSRTLTFPLRRADGVFEVTVKIPADGVTMDELRRLAWFLLPWATDFDPSASQPRAVFPMLESGGDSLHRS